MIFICEFSFVFVNYPFKSLITGTAAWALNQHSVWIVGASSDTDSL